MKTFLESVAEDLLNKFGTNLADVAIVFPNKRAALFLNEYLARKAQKPIWSPAYITISDLFRQQSTLAVGDQIKLICDLHKSFVKITGINETLDHFFSWGQLLLSDFDDIDKNMADAKQVFSNISNLHELDDVDYLSDNQRCSHVLPSIQVRQAYREDVMPPEEFEKALGYALETSSEGVVLYKWEDIAEDSIRLDIVRSVLAGK